MPSPEPAQNHSRMINRQATLLFTWAVISLIGCYLRLYPLFNHTSDDAREKASLLVMARIRQTVALSVVRGFPQLPPQQKNLLIQERFDQLLRDEKKKIRESINTLSRTIQKEEKLPAKLYLLASDSYYYYDLTENIVNTGHLASKIRGSKYFNAKMNAPLGFWEPLNLHPYVGYTIYRILAFFQPGIPLAAAVSWTPLFIMTLSVFPFLLICRYLGYSSLSSFAAGVFFVSSPIFLKRSMFGWYDNDPYSILFPLTILGLIFRGLNQTAKFKRRLAAGLAVLALCLYALFWHGWMFLASIIFIGGILSVLYQWLALKQKKPAQMSALFFIQLAAGCFLGISAIFGIKDFFALFREGLKALIEFQQPSFALWPDLYLAVGELKKVSFPFVVGLTGGPLFFLLAGFGAVMAVTRLIRREKRLFTENIILLLFTVVILLMAMGAQRFAILCLIPLSLLAGSGINSLLSLTKKNVARIPFRPGVAKGVTALLTFSLLALFTCVPFIRAQLKTESLMDPLFNATWDNSLSYIRENTPPESIINTWWPPGHFIKAVADRRVTFDGASINLPQGYWLANVLLSDNESRALGLLRMLNTSANKSVDELVNQGFKLSDAVDLLWRITALNRTDAQAYLEKDTSLPPDRANRLLSLTHGLPPPSYLLIYNDLIESSLLISFSGRWDFHKAEAARVDKTQRNKIPASGSKDYITFLWTIAGGYPRYSGVLKPVAITADKVVFQNNVIVDTQNMTCAIRSSEYGQGVPKNLVYLKDGEVITKELPGATLSYAVVFVQDGDSVRCALMDTFLARSLLMRLYFFNGAGLKFIRPVHEAHDLTGRTQIMLFKVDWPFANSPALSSQPAE